MPDQTSYIGKILFQPHFLLTMKALQLGILGVSGFFRKKIAIPVAKSPMIDICAIASRSAEKAKEAAKQYHIAQSFGSYEALLDSEQVEAIYIPLPNHLHAEYIKKAADAGKHIICEKPIALNAAEAQDCIHYAAEKGVKVMEAFMYKFHPQWLHVRELIRMREIGNVQGVNVFFGFNNTDPKNIRNMKASGGGALLDIGCYAVSCSRFLLDAEPNRVISLSQFDPQFGTDILFSGLMDFGYAHAQFTVGTQTFPYQRVDVHGSAGVITIDLPFNMHADVEARITVSTSVGTREVFLGPEDQYILEFEAFAKAIRNDFEVPTPPIDAVRNMTVLDALMESAGKGSWVEIE